MIRFPQEPVSDAGEYFSNYFSALANAYQTVDKLALVRAAALLENAIVRRATILTCGNGGSAAIANHFVCDCIKGARTDTKLLPRVHSLVTNIEINTAIANDIGYERVFSYQLESCGMPGDVLVAISSSGNSPNILNALEWAKSHGIESIAMTGFSGGKARRMASVSLHVDAHNYGLIEDVHQSLMHALAQYLRLRNMADHSLIGSRAF